MRKGVLREETRFQNETAVWCEASETLPELNLTRDLSKSAFKTLILEYHDRFAVGGKVRVAGYWMLKYAWGPVEIVTKCVTARLNPVTIYQVSEVCYGLI